MRISRLSVIGLFFMTVIAVTQVPLAHADNFGMCCANGRQFRAYLNAPAQPPICNWSFEVVERMENREEPIYRVGPTSSCTALTQSQLFDAEIREMHYFDSGNMTRCSDPLNWVANCP